MSLLHPRRDEEVEQEQLEEQIFMALEEWKAARNYFENVTDPDLVEYAAFKMETTKLKYQYMLKQARRLHPPRKPANELSRRKLAPQD